MKKLKPENPQRIYENAKSYLMRCNDKNESLYDLLADLVSFLHNSKKSKIYESQDGSLNVEALIRNVREDSFKFEGIPLVRNVTLQQRAAHFKNHYDMRSLFSKSTRRVFMEELQEMEEQQAASKKKQEEEEEKPATPQLYSPSIHDTIEDFNNFKLAGICLPEEEVYKIAIAMKQLAFDNKLKHIRFFGKFFGTEKNYYVIESEHCASKELTHSFKQPPPFMKPFNKLKKEEDGGEEKRPQLPDPATLPVEEGGTNKATYWVCNQLGEPWVKLPDVTPLQISIAKLVCKQLSGNLTKTIRSYPAFLGIEENLLRAQIARIVASTTVAPAGLLAENKDEEDQNTAIHEQGREKAEFKFADDFAEIPIQDSPEGATNLEKWVHLHEPIQEFGRCTKYRPPKPKSQNEEDAGEEEEAPEEIKKLLPLKEDSQGRPKKPTNSTEEEEGGEESNQENEGKDDKPSEMQLRVPSWTAKLFNLSNKPFAIALLKSNRWPGAYAYMNEKGRKFGNLYIGTGLKYEGNFTPLIPPKANCTVQEDPVEPVEKKDATVAQEKRVMQGEDPFASEKEEMKNEEEEEQE